MEKKLLQLLEENARLSNKQLAVMLNCTEEEVEAAIADYESRGILKGYKALVNWEKADENHATALIELKVTPKRESGFDEIADRVMAFDEVESVRLMSGGFDLAVTVSGKSMQDIALFVARRLSPLDGVLATSTHFVLTRYKEGGVSFKDDEIDERRGMLSD